MPPAYSNIKSLHAGKHEKGIILRLIRKYEVPDFYGGNQPNSLECIIHDEEGDRIHASIGKANIVKFSKILQEGSVYSIVEFVVGANRMKIRTTWGEHKMMIIKCTRIFEIYREDFPSYLYEFKTFAEVKDLDNNFPTFDVLGIVVCSYNPQMINCGGKVKRMMKLVLEDIEGQTIRCTLWERYAEQMLTFIQTGPEAPPGLILQFCTTNIFKGEVELQNCYDTTKLICDQSQAEIMEYKAKYYSKHGKDKGTSISTLTASTTPAKSIVEEHKDGGVQLKTLAELQSCSEEGDCLVYATDVCLENPMDWAYNSCKICRKKLHKEGLSYECQSCGLSDAKTILRYKLILRVVDDTETALFLLWDKEAVELLGKHAAAFKAGEELPNVSPELEGIVALYKVKNMPQERASELVYTVVKVVTDRSTIKDVCGENAEPSVQAPSSNSGAPDVSLTEMEGSSSAAQTTPKSLPSAMGNDVLQGDSDPNNKCLIDESSTSNPKKRLKRMKQDK